jgi:F-type H+-transporting ATPase subunit delta
VKAQELSRKYATAVFSLALETWIATLNTVQDKLAHNAELAAGLQDQKRSFAERQKELDGIIPAKTDQSIRNFLYTLLKEGQMELLAGTLAEIGRMVQGGTQVQVAYVTTSVALSESDQDQFRKKLRAQYGEALEFEFKVDPAIIGGAVVQVGDQVIDGSVATRLDAMRNTLGVKT